MLNWIQNLQRNGPKRAPNFASTHYLEISEDWAWKAVQHFEALEGEKRAAWEQLIYHAYKQNKTRPSRTWLKEAAELIAAVGEQEVLEYLAALLPAVRANESVPMEPHAADYLKGLVWLSTQIEDERMISLIGNLAVAAYHKLQGIGPRSKKVGNACVMALGEMGNLEAVSQLARLRQKINYSSVKSLIQNTLHQVAAQLDLGIHELEEISVPEVDVDDDGKMRQMFGEFQGEIAMVGRSAAVKWRKPDGKMQKSTPAAVKRDYSQELKDFRKAAKDARAQLSAQKERIEGQFLVPREMPYEHWAQYYLNHSLMKVLARDLIWVFVNGERTQVGIWHQGQMVDIDGRAIEGLGERTQVSLWHPIDIPTGEVLAWRTWLLAQEIQQPIKQAFREIYVLTAAEETTRTYSNRFAGHILRQHQFNSLAKLRGWRFNLHGGWDGGDDWAALTLPEHNLIIEFVIESVHGDALYADSGVCLYVSTDQVRFVRSREVLPIDQIPPRVLSEVLRDVDLFVGVCSIGNDPEWEDRGELPRQYQGYWRQYSFGDLSASAEMRKQTLELLLPRLKIRDQAWLAGRFLYVKGNFRTYKIHLGSANILMEPNDQYLCIVANRSYTQEPKNVFLPFEGDQIFSIILSKAFLLAEDNKIKDRTITQQIHRR